MPQNNESSHDMGSRRKDEANQSVHFSLLIDSPLQTLMITYFIALKYPSSPYLPSIVYCSPIAYTYYHIRTTVVSYQGGIMIF